MYCFAQMLPGILTLSVGIALGYGVRELISRRRRNMYRDGRLRDRRSEDRFVDEDILIAPGDLPPKADIKAANENVDR